MALYAYIEFQNEIPSGGREILEEAVEIPVFKNEKVLWRKTF
jgi:hypothetical protein